ncbi:hypothetical protein DWB58_28720 [candidate division KSB1 bacterium]|nr:hypothetical protein [candidate division KSB1 bacterium]
MYCKRVKKKSGRRSSKLRGVKFDACVTLHPRYWFNVFVILRLFKTKLVPFPAWSQDSKKRTRDNIDLIVLQNFYPIQKLIDGSRATLFCLGITAGR